MATHSLPNTENAASGSLKDTQKSASFLPAGTKTGAWPDHEKMQARLANLQLARGAQVELPPRSAAPNKVGGIDAGALHALMGAGKPVVPAELRTREGARRALAKKREAAPPEKKSNPPVEVASPGSASKQAEPAASKMPVTRLSGSVRETRDERGTTWQGWTPKPGSRATKEEKPRPQSSSKNVPKPEPARSPSPHTSAKPPASTPGGFKANKIATSASRKTDQKTDNQRWSGLYSVFSNPVAETSGFWEDAGKLPALKILSLQLYTIPGQMELWQPRKRPLANRQVALPSRKYPQARQEPRKLRGIKCRQLRPNRVNRYHAPRRIL